MPKAIVEMASLDLHHIAVTFQGAVGNFVNTYVKYLRNFVHQKLLKSLILTELFIKNIGKRFWNAAYFKLACS